MHKAKVRNLIENLRNMKATLSDLDGLEFKTCPCADELCEQVVFNYGHGGYWSEEMANNIIESREMAKDLIELIEELMKAGVNIVGNIK